MGAELPFDINGLLLSNGIVTLVIALGLIYIRLARPTSPGFRMWVFAGLSGGIGLVFATQSETITPWISVGLSSTLQVLATLLVREGVLRLNWAQSRPHNSRPGALTLAITGITILAYIAVLRFIHDDDYSRFLVYYSAMCIAWGLLALTLLQTLPRSLGRLALVPAYISGAAALQQASFIALYILRPDLRNSMDAGVLYLGVLIWALVLQISTLIGMLHLDSLWLGQQLESQRQEIANLRLLLPVCAHCKKIRDDAGSWQDVDEYLYQQTQVKVSHDLCPHCTRELYPEVADKVEERLRRSAEG